jgi:hypothetical protein
LREKSIPNRAGRLPPERNITSMSVSSRSRYSLARDVQVPTLAEALVEIANTGRSTGVTDITCSGPPKVRM